MKLNVVFTGPATNQAGQSITRDNLRSACGAVGITVQSSIRSDTNLLVASRRDTVKARNAQMLGVEVMGYESFINIFLRGLDLPVGGPSNPYVDSVNQTHVGVAFQGNEKLSLIDIL